MGAPPITPPGGGVAPPAVEYTSETIPQITTFSHQGIPPPSPLYIGRDDALRLLVRTSTVSGITLTLTLRLLRPDGVIVPITQDFLASGVGSQSQVFQLTEGFLLAATVYVFQGNIKRGQVWVQLELVRGPALVSTFFQVLISDLLPASFPLGWPGGLMRAPTEGRGALLVIIGTDPVAGVEISESVPTNARWALRSVTFTLVTDATAGNRLVTLLIDDGANIFSRVEQINVQPPSSTKNYTYAPGYALTAAQINTFTGPFPVEFALRPGMRFRTSTQNLVAGDNYGPPVYLVEEWVDA